MFSDEVLQGCLVYYLRLSHEKFTIQADQHGPGFFYD